FQAEDGIRDYKVTGVQTCALPIYSDRGPAGWLAGSAAAQLSCGGGRRAHPRCCWLPALVGVERGIARTPPPRLPDSSGGCPALRSEERRVGKGVGVCGGRIVCNKW